jgi:hypothetical protein
MVCSRQDIPESVFMSTVLVSREGVLRREFETVSDFFDLEQRDGWQIGPSRRESTTFLDVFRTANTTFAIRAALAMAQKIVALRYVTTPKADAGTVVADKFELPAAKAECESSKYARIRARVEILVHVDPKRAAFERQTYLLLLLNAVAEFIVEILPI